jgi:cytochrome c oxidase subunit 2
MIRKLLLALSALPLAAFADAPRDPWNMTVGATAISREVYSLHMTVFWVMVAIAVVVFGTMLYSIVMHRRSKNPKPATFHHSTAVEIVWTTIPFVILVALAVPAAGTLIKMEDTRNAEMIVEATGYQWKWQYNYRNADNSEMGVNFFSTLNANHNLARQLKSGVDPKSVPNYLWEVDNRVVIPTGKKIKFRITSNDVIHAWWVFDLAIKKDALPGIINEVWTKVDQPGVYRGVCAELCGRDHGFMPIVVEAMEPVQFEAWLKSKGGTLTVAKVSTQIATDAIAPVVAAATSAAAPAASSVAVATTVATADAAASSAPSFPVKVVFAAGQKTLTEDNQAQIKAVVAYLQANPSANVTLTGYTDKSGNADKNKELAKERAKAVRELLKAAGLTEGRWSMKPPAEITGTGAAEEARRVEINLATSEVAAATAPVVAVKPEAVAEVAAAKPVKLDKAALMTKGEKVYAQCAACHQANGEGMKPAFPALKGSAMVAGPAAAQITQVLKGKNAMPAFAGLSDEEIAAVITYTRNSWGNSSGIVQPSQVTALRK